MAKRAADRQPFARPLASPRIILRPMTDDDIAALQSWYGEAAAAVRGQPGDERPNVQELHAQLEAARADPKRGLLAITRRDDPTPIGLLDYRGDNPAPGWLTVGLIAVAAGQRGWGDGSEAVRLLEEEARGRGATRFRAAVHMRNGLGFYFWLRLGYRPAGPDEQFWPPAAPSDVIWMVRVAA